MYQTSTSSTSQIDNKKRNSKIQYECTTPPRQDDLKTDLRLFISGPIYAPESCGINDCEY